MKNLEEELKSIRDSENKPAPTLIELKEIAKTVQISASKKSLFQSLEQALGQTEEANKINSEGKQDDGKATSTKQSGINEVSYKQIKSKRILSRLLPECYTTFEFKNVNLKNLHEETLFFIFYSLPESDLQLRSYNELIYRGYVFSKTLDQFVFVNDQIIADNKRKTVAAFDPLNWEKVAKEVIFDSSFVNGLHYFVSDE